MPQTPLPSWPEIAVNYDTFLVDMVGVVHDGIEAFPNAIRALRNLSAHQNVIFVSNTPRPSSLSIDKLKNYGVDFPFEIITSGDYARYNLQQDIKSYYYHLGAHGNKEILKGMNVLTTVDIKKAKKVLLTAFIESTEDPHQFDEMLKMIATRKISVYCANPDKYAFNGKAIRLCAGFFAQKLSDLGVDVKIWGKPGLGFYTYVADMFPHLVKNKKRCLMIGDTLDTDIKGANRFGIDSLFISSGISSKIESPDSLAKKLQSPLTKPTFILPTLAI